jgi:hypothetical protein
MSSGLIVKRGIRIDSDHDLYKLLIKYPDICSGELKKFKNKFHLYLYGCPCNKDSNKRESLGIYINLENISEYDKEEFKKKINVSFIQFNLNNKEIFRW